MAPHAISPVRTETRYDGVRTVSPKAPKNEPILKHRTMIPHTHHDEVHDMVCVGFGPASLAIATALHDSLELKQNGSSDGSHVSPKVSFVEKQPSFRWHAGMQLPGAKMQISWIKDLATLRNPRSSFTFLNYLWSVGRLLQFSNLGTFLPTRLEYEAYLKWVAAWFEHLVDYSQECVEIVAEDRVMDKPIQTFVVKTRNTITGEFKSIKTKHVVVASGGRAHIPRNLPQDDPRVIHSSAYVTKMLNQFPERERPYRFVVVGSGQSAAEVFCDLQKRYSNCQARLLIRQGALRPSDDSPFVNEVFNPDRVDDVFATTEGIRSFDILNDRSTNYGVVRLELLEAIYHDLYIQSISHDNQKELPHQILPYREVMSVDQKGKRLRIHIRNSEPLHRKGEQICTDEIIDADAMIVATGYDRDAYKNMLANLEHLMPVGEATRQDWSVRRDYSVIFEPNTVSTDAGVWLQGSNETTHGLSDTLLSILAIRGQEIVHSIFGKEEAVAC